jgi:phosphoserine aminotransferase
MSEPSRPHLRPFDPRFSCGPTKKHPGWSAEQLANGMLGRSHRANGPRQRIVEAYERTAALLECPPGYKVSMVAGSDTGAMEAAMWSLLGPRGVDVFAWDVFGGRWTKDARDELKLDDLRIFEASGGQTPDFSQADPARDIVFTWNATAAGARIPDTDWLSADREGLTIVDATSAAFAMELDWSKIDVLTYSWQKSLGGEAQHGMIILGPRALERLASHKPAWPVPRILQLHNAEGTGVNEVIFEGKTLNTPSLLCFEDYLLALKWAAKEGGLPALIGRVNRNFDALSQWVERTGWIDFLCTDPATRSPVSVTLKFAEADIAALAQDRQWELTRKMVALLERENAALDINPHPSAPAGLRIWCGPTVDADDIGALGPWLDWAYATAKADF